MFHCSIQPSIWKTAAGRVLEKAQAADWQPALWRFRSKNTIVIVNSRFIAISLPFDWFAYTVYVVYTVIIQDVDSCRLLSFYPGALRTSTFTLSSNTGEIPWNSYLPITLLSWPKLKHWSRAAITMLWLSYAAICSYDWVASWAMYWSCICDHRSFAWIQGRSAWANAGHYTRSYKDISWHIDAIWYKYIQIQNIEWVCITRKRWSQSEFCQVCQGNQCTET